MAFLDARNGPQSTAKFADDCRLRMSSLRIRNLVRYTSLMRSRASRIAAMLALLTCLVCPLVETFDNWDHTIQTGNDTEYALVLLALCVGVSYSFARFFFNSALLRFVSTCFFHPSST